MTRFLLLALLLLARAAYAEPALPDTPAGRALGAWLQAFNAADREALADFDLRHGQLQPLDDTLGFRDYTGGFDLVAVHRSQTHDVAVDVRERDGEMTPVRLTLRLDPAAPAKLLALDVDPQHLDRLDQAAALAGLAQRAQALADTDQFSGAFLVARRGEVLLQQAHGWANRAEKIPARLDTRFRFASAGKMFTAVAVLQQVQAGTLSLDATLGEYLPDYPNAALARQLTLRQMLTHTGGTGGLDSLEPDYAGDRAALRTHADYVAMHGGRSPAFTPGSKVEYSNYGFILLAAILERATGRDYYRIVREDVLGPAGMTATGMEPESSHVPNRAVAYRRKDGEWVDTATTLPWRGTAAGGGYTTVGDLFKFAQALQGGKLLSPELLAQATSPQMQENWYGFGFITVGQGGLRRYGHGGDADGMNADFRVFPESGWVLISLSNLDPPAAYRLTRWFEPRMPVDAAQ